MVTQNEFDPPPHNATLAAHPILDQVAFPCALFLLPQVPTGGLVAMVSWLSSLVEADDTGTGVNVIPMWSTRFKHAI